MKECISMMMSWIFQLIRLGSPRDAGHVPVVRRPVVDHGSGASNCESVLFVGPSLSRLRWWRWIVVALWWIVRPRGVCGCKRHVPSRSVSLGIDVVSVQVV